MIGRSLLLLALMVSCNVAIARGPDEPPDPVTGSGPESGPKDRWVYPVLIDESKNDEETCRLKWDRYIKSQECFAPFKNVNGTMKPGAEYCTQYGEPSGDCPAHPQ